MERGGTTTGRLMRDQSRTSSVDGTPAVRSAVAEERVSAGSIFMRAFMSGLAAPVMAFTTAPRYIVMKPGASVPAAWRSVAQHVSVAFDEQHR